MVEILLTGHEAQDTEVKRRAYADAGVPEYWIVDPERREVTFLHLTADGYRATAAGEDGRYRSWSVPGLAVVVEQVWQEGSIDEVFEIVAGPRSGSAERPPRNGGLGWGSLPFDPRPGLAARYLEILAQAVPSATAPVVY